MTVALDHPGPSYIPEFSFNKLDAQSGAGPKSIIPQLEPAEEAKQYS